jgi:uncharacterized membrane protein YccC
MDRESMEPTVSWGLRMAVATTVPVVWGISTNHLQEGEWIALTADCICWVALKGTYAQRLRVLLGGTVLAMIFGALGSITGHSLWLSVGFMLVVAFLAGLFKNLGERGAGLALCLYVMFLIANAHPVSGAGLTERLQLTLIGGMWNTVLGMLLAFFVKDQQPYRRTISLIWHSAATLMNKIKSGWDGRGVRTSQRELYTAERDVRLAIDGSFAFHERAAHQVGRHDDDAAEYQLAQVRKAAALVAAHMIAIAEELEGYRLQSIDEELRIRLASLMRAVQRATSRMGVLVLTKREEEVLLMRDTLDAIRTALSALEEYKGIASIEVGKMVRRVMQLSIRCGRLMERSMERLAAVSESRMFRAYPVLKTIYVLHPRHWWRSIRLLFSIDSHTARYAVRTAVAAAIATGIYKWFDIEHGYWLPFTVILVMQPYFVATLRKAIDRLIGTVAGGIAGGLLLLLPANLHLKEGLLFFSAIAMIHFYKAQYRVSAFFITLNLVVLFSVSQELDKQLILLRAGLTVVGAVIGVIAGFLLLPAWDKKWLPRFLARALERNWVYFVHTFCESSTATWTKYKRGAEVANSNAYDSFSRAVQEPGGLGREYSSYYQFITHNVRLTRDLNNLHLEEEGKDDSVTAAGGDTETIQLINACATLFTEALNQVTILTGRPLKIELDFKCAQPVMHLNAAQKLYLSKLHKELQALLQNLYTLTHTGADNQINGPHSQLAATT